MSVYTPNSHKYKAEQASGERQKLDKVVTGAVKVKKKSDVPNIKDVFISEDASKVKNYILMDVLIPAIKKAVSDIVTNGIDMILYGESSGSTKRSTSDRVSYRSYYDRGRTGSVNATQTRNGYSYDDIILATRGEAEEVLARMDEIMETYGTVRVADLYDLVGVSGNFTDNDYGWTNIRNAKPVRTRDGGYMLQLPRAIPIRDK